MERRRGIIVSVTGLLILAVNVIDAADRGSSVWNIIAIAAGAFMLFYGFIIVGNSGPSSP